MNLLKPLHPNPNKANPVTDDLIDIIIKGRMSADSLKFFMEEVYNCKLLQRLDENCILVFQNLDEEINEKMMSIVERVLLYLSDLRGLVKAKQV